MPDGGNVRSAVSGWEPIATPPRKSVVEKWVPILDEKKFVGKNAVIKYVDLEENESGKTLRAQVYDMGRDFATEQFGLSEEFKTQVPEMPQWLNDDEIAKQIGDIDKIIKKNYGSVKKTEKWGRKKLAYEIKP